MRGLGLQIEFRVDFGPFRDEFLGEFLRGFLDERPVELLVKPLFLQDPPTIHHHRPEGGEAQGVQKWARLPG